MVGAEIHQPRNVMQGLLNPSAPISVTVSDYGKLHLVTFSIVGCRSPDPGNQLKGGLWNKERLPDLHLTKLIPLPDIVARTTWRNGLVLDLIFRLPIHQFVLHGG